jgi:ADP-ribose pyrophosphatase YjhB (NUDIX family)
MGRFNLRVYGIFINPRGELLVSDERRNGFCFTKFPGGGVEIGEGLQDALRREFQEEMNRSIQIDALFYFNEYYQVSAFNSSEQLHSFYYIIFIEDWESIHTHDGTLQLTEDGEKHRWIPLARVHEDHFTFPIDKEVMKKIYRENRNM